MITVSEITVKHGENIVINCVSLQIEPGEFISIVGENGSGKTSLARCLNGLIKPYTGTVCVGDLNTDNPKNKAEIHRRVGMVFQNPEDQLVANSVESELAFGLENLCLPTQEIRKRVESAIEIFNLQSLRNRPPQKLSGGEKQRLAIASSYIMHPDFLILDEPTALLDNHHQNQILSHLRVLNSEFGIGIILITHSPQEAAQAHRILILNKGEIVGNASPRKIYYDLKGVQKFQLETPFSTKLGIAINESKNALSIDEFVENWNKPILSNTRLIKPSAENTSGVISIELKNIQHNYEDFTTDSKPSMSNLNLSFYKGSLHAVIGKSGSGKTTLAQHLNRLLIPESGSVLINKKNIMKYSVSDLVSTVGLIFQFPELQLFEETVEEDVAFGPKRIKITPKEIAERIENALLQVNLPLKIYGKRSPQNLSSGEKRRVAIAGIIAMDPEIIILDEPTAGLDPKTSKKLCAMMRKLAKKHQKTIIWITHDVDAAAYWADKITVMTNGSVTLSGKTRDVFTSDDFEEKTDLSPPSSVILYEKMKARGYVMPYIPITLDETISILAPKIRELPPKFTSSFDI